MTQHDKGEGMGFSRVVHFWFWCMAGSLLLCIALGVTAHITDSAVAKVLGALLGIVFAACMVEWMEQAEAEYQAPPPNEVPDP